MKKILTMLVVAMLATSVQAQFRKGTWSLQPQVGIGLTGITNAEPLTVITTDIDKVLSVGALLGLELQYQATTKVSFAAGVNYSMQGCQWEDFEIGTQKFDRPRIELGYFKIPVVANYHFGKGWAVKAGVQFGFMSDASFRFKYEDKFGGRDATMDTQVDVKDEFKTFDFSIPFGISYESSDHWIVDARYQLGLTAINKEGDKNYKNSVFMLTIGKKFSL